MKIEKLNDEEVVYVLDLTKKINEIIDVLNKNFIIDEPDTINIPHNTAFVMDLSVNDVMICPYCGRESMIKYYAMNDTLCYRCKDCGKELFI